MCSSDLLEKPQLMNEESTNKTARQAEPSADSLAEMPELSDPRFKRRPGRGHHASLSVGEIVAIDTDLWPHFGSQKAVNDALRKLVEENT